jgi:hypothetical protein
MGKIEKVIEKILRGTADKNISFSELCQILHHLGFEERTPEPNLAESLCWQYTLVQVFTEF